jgi:hypothetical protein
MLQERRDFARQRQAIIAASAELRERELIKLASLSDGIAERLRARGVAEPAASLTGEVAMAVFRSTYERWIDDANDRDFPELIREALGELKAVTAGA